ncbi:DUF4352 domain-containing protein [Nocardia tengchongensis]
MGLVLSCGGCLGLAGVAGKSTKSATVASNAPFATSAAAPQAPAAKEAAKLAPVGTEVRDGKFGFTVNQVETGVKTVGTNPYLKKDAQGSFVVVHVSVSNTSGKPQTYFGSNQKLYDVQGRQFSNDTMAEMNVNDQSVIGAEINPGNRLDVAIVFDLPAEAEPQVIEFHDSMFSGGAKASLR